jgi:hypothetical protein
MPVNELDLLVKRVRRTLTPEATPIARSLELYQRFGPILFSHFYRATHDEQKAMAATRVAFERLLATGLTEDRDVVSWVRGLDAESLH